MTNKARGVRLEARGSDGNVAAARRAPFLTHASGLTPHAFPRGLTLVELLVTMVIIAIIAAAILGTAGAALDAARRSRTQSIILKIHTLVMERWADYETRRVDLNPFWTGELTKYVRGAANPAERAQRLRVHGQMMADLRLLALRELMKYEMPDRWFDVGDGPQFEFSANRFLARPPALARNYYRQLRRVADVADEETVLRNQGAECLYMTVMAATGDGEAREQFTDQDIGDTDEDGAPEILDGWGRPISWVRWPAGFAGISEVMSGDPVADHDPFDLYRRQQSTARPSSNQIPNTMSDLRPYIARLREIRDPQYPSGYRLLPLVYSSGPDGISDINTSPGIGVFSNDVQLDPYALDPNPTGDDEEYQFGQPMDDPDDPDGDDNWLDNIHNHLIEY
jgi:prepilin-type N-terminal cleavage/methylation domain-containing protein